MTFYSDNNFTYVNLTNEMVGFLTNYSPRHQHFTSVDEMRKVSDILELETMTIDALTYIRNSVVKFYTDLSRTNTDNGWNYTVSMMSVTAVIDHIIYNY